MIHFAFFGAGSVSVDRINTRDYNLNRLVRSLSAVECKNRDI